MNNPFFFSYDNSVIYYPCAGTDLQTITFLLEHPDRNKFFKNDPLTFVFIDADVQTSYGLRADLDELQYLIRELNIQVVRKATYRLKSEYLEKRAICLNAAREKMQLDLNIDISLFNEFFNFIENEQKYKSYSYYLLEYNGERFKLYFIYDDAYLTLDVLKQLYPSREQNLILKVPGGGWLPTNYLWSPESPFIKLMDPSNIFTMERHLEGLNRIGYSEFCLAEDNYSPWYWYESLKHRKKKIKSFIRGFYSID
jgi:hypothetical protein